MELIPHYSVQNGHFTVVSHVS